MNCIILILVTLIGVSSATRFLADSQHHVQTTHIHPSNQNVEKSFQASTNFISLAGCGICLEIVKEVGRRSIGYDYGSLKFSLGKSCRVINDLIRKTRCHLFVHIRADDLIRAIIRYHKAPQRVCVAMDQC